MQTSRMAIGLKSRPHPLPNKQLEPLRCIVRTSWDFTEECFSVEVSGAIIAVNYERRHLVRSVAISTVRMLLFVVWLVPSLSAHAQNRVALVVGNNAYESVPKLEKAINDAKAVSASLQAI